MSYYIMLHLTSMSLLIYNLPKDSNAKVKLERSRLWQLDNSRRKLVREDDGRGGNTTQNLFFFDLHFLWGCAEVDDRWNRKLLDRLYFIVFFMYVCMCECVSVPLSLCLSVSLIESLSVCFLFPYLFFNDFYWSR